MSKLYPNAPFIAPTEDADDADDDICPVCDGKCTCRNTVQQIPQPRQREVDPIPDNRPKPLKIRLTVPPNLLHARKSHPCSSNKPSSKKSDSVNPNPPKQIKQAKRRQATSSGSGRTVFLQSSSSRNAQASSSRKIQRPRCTPAAVRSGYPTFMPASALTIACDSDSFESSDSLSSLSSSDTEDAAIAQHNNDNQMYSSSSSSDDDDIFNSHQPDKSLLEERARLRRELLGSQGSHDRHRKRFYHGGNARKDHTYHNSNSTTSDSGDDANVNSISDNDDDENQADEEEGGQNDEADESDEESVGAARYIGFATGWSDDEESSFDADVFFAGLSDGSSDDGFDPMDLDQGQETATSFLAPQRPLQQRSGSDISLQNALQAEFEVAESWDGQIVFTNKFRESHSRPHPISDAPGADASSVTTPSDTPFTPSECDDDDDDGVFVSDGETTEEELVGVDGLPTEMAMGLFCMPMSSNSSIHPSTTPSHHTKKHRNPRKDIPTGSSKAVSGPWMGGFCHNLVTHPAHAVIEPATTKDSIPRPFFQPSAWSSSRRRRRQDSITDSSMPPSSPCISSSLDVTSDAFEIDIDDFLNDTCSDEATSSTCPDGSLFSPAPEVYNHTQNLHRWDLISVGAFRTREPLSLLPSSPFITHPSPTSPAKPMYPTSSLHGGNTNTDQNLRTVTSSPTPTVSTFNSKHIPQKDPKIRTVPRAPREPKKPKKMKYRVHHHYHKHLHHPNMKKRGTISVQRIKSTSTGTTSSPL